MFYEIVYATQCVNNRVIICIQHAKFIVLRKIVRNEYDQQRVHVLQWQCNKV